VPWEIVAHNVLGAADLRGQRLEWLGQALRHGALNLRRYQ
jgi:hypothetical protein